MPVTTDTLRNTKKVTILFAITSVVMTISLVWLVMVDYQRPWKDHQAQYMNNEAVIAELQYLVTQQQDYQEQLREADELVKRRSRDVDMANNPEYAQLIDDISTAKQELYGLDLTFKQKDALIVVTRTSFEEAMAVHGADGEPTRVLREKLETDEQLRLEALAAKEQAEDHLKALERKRRDLEKPYSDALRELTFLQSEVKDAQKRREDFSSILYRAGLNVPLLDFAAPPGTPARFEVKQVVAHDVKTKLNFLEGYQVDRCTTCHVVIDDKNFSEEALVDRFEKFIPAIQEELAREGQSDAPVIELPDPPTVFGFTPEQLRGNVSTHWAAVDEDEGNAYFTALQDAVNGYLAYANLPTIDLGEPLQAHPNLDLFLADDSPHPIKQMGCTVCHEGNGQETDFILAAHTPNSHEQRDEWSEKYYDRNLGVPTMTWHTLAHFWDFPMVQPQYSEASCSKCHTQVDDIGHFATEPHGQKLRHGQKLFTQLGCINCHLVEGIGDSRQVGTDLTHVSSKLSDGFLHHWIMNPQGFRPSTRMPHFFEQENNGPGSENTWDPNPELRTQAEVMAITDYLKHVSEPWDAEPLPQSTTGDVARGQELFGTVGCLACHGNIAEYGEKWIVDDISHQLAVNQRSSTAEAHRARMAEVNEQIKTAGDKKLDDEQIAALHSEYAELLKKDIPSGDATEDDFRETAEERFAEMGLNDQVYYAMKHFTEQRRAEAKDSAERERMTASLEGRDIDKLMMYIPPLFTRYAPELSGIGSKVDAAWLYTWLREPRHYSSYTKMPRMRLTEQEALDLTAYLMTLKHDAFSAEAYVVDSTIEEELDRRLSDILSGQNSQATVERIKNDDDGILTRLLESSVGGVHEGLSLTDKKMLFVGSKMIAHYGCFACHAIGGFEGAARPGTEMTAWGEKNIHQLDFAFFGGAYHDTLGETEEFQVLYPQARDDLLVRHNHDEDPGIEVMHTHASFATYKMLNPRIWDREKFKKPYEKLKMPNFYLEDDEADALVTYLLSRRPARVAESLQIPYATESSGPIAEGRQLVQELNCTGCHQIEDNVAPIHQFITLASDDGGDGDDDFDFDFGDEDEDENEEDEETIEEQDEGLAKLGSRYGGEYDIVNAPPWLRGEGAKVQPDWFHGFLLNVETLRPWTDLKVRMPSFYLTNDQASTLVDYFSALARKESEDLRDQLTKVEQTIAKSPDPVSAEQEWYTIQGLENIAHQWRHYAINNKLALERDFDFSSRGDAQAQKVFGKVLSDIRFFAHLYDVQYPFEIDGFTWMNEEQFARGEKLFHELKCLSCHVLGDETVPGSNQNPTAPNLALTHERLRYEWYHQWLQEPGSIQPGTKMPQWFEAGKSAYAAFDAELRDPFEAAFGKTGAEQMRLLLDFVWQAGETNYTAILPGADTSADMTSNPVQPESTQLETVEQPRTVRTVSAEVLSDPILGRIGPGVASDGRALGTITGRVAWEGPDVTPSFLPVADRLRDACGGETKQVGGLAIQHEGGGVGGCVVYLATGPEYMPEPAPATAVTLSMNNCRFDRPVSIVPVGATVKLVNNDAAAHNIQGRIEGTLLWSKNLVEQGATTEVTLTRPGIVEVRIPGFDWMSHHIWVVDHAGYALTNDSGEFQLQDIPPGEYDLHVWHPGWTLNTEASTGEPGAPIGRLTPVAVGGKILVLPGHPTEVTLTLGASN